MEDFKIDIMIDSGPSARSVQISLNQFTLIGATVTGQKASTYRVKGLETKYSEGVKLSDFQKKI